MRVLFFWDLGRWAGAGNGYGYADRRMTPFQWSKEMSHCEDVAD